MTHSVALSADVTQPVRLIFLGIQVFEKFISWCFNWIDTNCSPLSWTAQLILYLWWGRGLWEEELSRPPLQMICSFFSLYTCAELSVAESPNRTAQGSTKRRFWTQRTKYKSFKGWQLADSKTFRLFVRSSRPLVNASFDQWFRSLPGRLNTARYISGKS